jgi:hypothetical protein
LAPFGSRCPNQHVQDPLSSVLDGRAVEKSRDFWSSGSHRCTQNSFCRFCLQRKPNRHRMIFWLVLEKTRYQRNAVVQPLAAQLGMTLLFLPSYSPKTGRGRGTSLNSTCLTPKPLASSVYVHVPEAPSPRKLAISVMSLFPSPDRLRTNKGFRRPGFGLSSFVRTEAEVTSLKMVR